MVESSGPRANIDDNESTHGGMEVPSPRVFFLYIILLLTKLVKVIIVILVKCLKVM